MRIEAVSAPFVGCGAMLGFKNPLTLPALYWLAQWDFPQYRSNRAYEPVRIIEQFLVSSWWGENRFAHANMSVI